MFKTFPDLLILHMRKFQLINWVPTKLGELTNPALCEIADMSEIPVQVGDWLTLDDLQGKGRQAGEGELDLDAAPACKLAVTSGSRSL
jgi:ubiquitin carboxyl-terminal hydrolase 5/13